jgi:hypothetical protein
MVFQFHSIYEDRPTLSATVCERLEIGIRLTEILQPSPMPPMPPMSCSVAVGMAPELVVAVTMSMVMEVVIPDISMANDEVDRRFQLGLSAGEVRK